MHSLLKRQLKRQFGESFAIPPQWQPFIDRVDEAYQEFDADRKMLEHSLELSSQELIDANSEMRAVFQAIPDLVFRIDQEGTILDIKAGAAADLLIERQGLIGKRVQSIPLADVARQFAQAIAAVVSHNKLVDIEYAAVMHGQESHYEARLVPLPDRQIAVIIRNVTERKQSLRLLGSAVEQSTESIMITDAQAEDSARRILFVNPAFTRMTGYTAAEAVGQSPAMLLGPKSDPAAWVDLVTALREGRSFFGETINYRKDGTYFPVESQMVPIRNSSGTITHVLGIRRDLSERKRAEAELAKAHRELVDASRQAGMAEIASNVLHNVGNILNSVNVSAGLIGGMLHKSRVSALVRAADLLQAHAGDVGDFLANDPKGQLLPGYLQRVTNAVADEHRRMAAELAHLNKSIDHIKSVVATQQSFARTVNLVEPVQVCDLAEDALRMNGGELARLRVAVEKRFEPVPIVNLDRPRTLQILVNLINNASQAMENVADDSRRITLHVGTINGHSLRIAVQDQGEGIPAENLTRIFAHGFTTRATGHGFGLHSCALAARQMGGTLSAHSDGPGRGATFTLDLPIDGVRRES
ncbi:MAG: PAS domain S-box protein [Pseudomonadota bacterium]